MNFDPPASIVDDAVADHFLHTPVVPDITLGMEVFTLSVPTEPHSDTLED